MSLRYTLVTDGPSDRVLKPILDWTCRNHYAGPVEGHWFDPRLIFRKSITLEKRIQCSLEYFPCDILFVHRDAEGGDAQLRYREIDNAFDKLSMHSVCSPYICIVPVRMTEAWLLIDENAIRKAVGNPNGKIDLSLPQSKNIENLPDPKSILFETFKIASELAIRCQNKLNLPQCRLRLSEIINDFSPLRVLPAFKRFESDVSSFCRSYLTELS